jgi:IstB-like ATP binding protein
MAKALSEPMALPESQARIVAARLGLLVDRERTVRSDRRLTTRVRQAKWRRRARGEDRDSRPPRGRDTSLLRRLAACPWGHERYHVLITGPTGSAKTWLAGAVGPKAWREGSTVLPRRWPRRLQARPLAQGDGRSPKLMAALATTAFLLLADWGWPPSRMSTAATGANSWQTGTGAARPSSPVRSRWRTGRRRWGSLPWLMLALTGGFITRTK